MCLQYSIDRDLNLSGIVQKDFHLHGTKKVSWMRTLTTY